MASRGIERLEVKTAPTSQPRQLSVQPGNSINTLLYSAQELTSIALLKHYGVMSLPSSEPEATISSRYPGRETQITQLETLLSVRWPAITLLALVMLPS